MRLLYIANARIPTEKAHGIQIMQMCNAFANSNLKSQNSKFEVELILPKRLNPIKGDPFEYYGVEKNFEIKRLPCLDLIPLIKYIGPLGFWIESFTFLISAFFYTLFKKADIIYTRDFLLLPLTFFKKNIFFEAHAFPKNYFLYSPFFKKIKGLVVTAQKLKDFFIAKGMSPEKTLVAPNGVDLRNFDISQIKEDCRKKLDLPINKNIVLYTGHLYQWKGVDTLAQAREYLPKNAEIFFVGGTTEDIKKFKNRYLKQGVHILGHKPHQEIPYYLKAADILVLPDSAKENILKYGASPIKLFEYMASKRPIVASDLPSIREILNENNSVLVKPDDPKELAKGIQKILESPQLAQKISAKAFEDVREYTWARRAEKVLRFISSKI